MKLAHRNLSKPIIIEPSKIQLLYIENPKFLREILQDFMQNENFILSDDDKEYSSEKFISINTDLISLEISQRKIINAIFSFIKEMVLKDLYQESHEILMALNRFASKIVSNVDFPIGYDDIEIEAVLKSLNIKIIKSDNLLEQILDLMILERDFLQTKLFVFFGLKTFLTKDEVLLLYDEIILRQFNVLLVEPFYQERLECENIVIIDKDFCEIRN
ncbi:type II-A CRISPR-associated protein Csn2 [Campylobacter geochelonis]|uniref:CRISPR type II-A/NMEMI-associated protein Csn2 n=1 Tax=Campylobacter geochelonis TaxID=1780362 RepID=A0A128ECN8_9BACT|nr:type II-A CRISPR-associated protein Csn2 [Campylobacter geochelonis]QKF70457.1 CRISPR/Cas system-associated protein Csn2, type II-A [Campylobacter geochelonis]CZE46247.1 CRISPR type II-A/NMEMI-associated protein Csn2 [Campylobacter geochelonis]